MYFLGATYVQAQEEIDSSQTFVDDWEGSEEDEYEFRPYYRKFDSASVILRNFDTTKIEILKKDPEMKYTYTKATLSLWDRFWIWFGQQLSELFYAPSEVNWFRFFTYIVFTLIIVYAIFRLLKLDTFKVFVGLKHNQQEQKSFFIEENIHEMDFEALMNEALLKQENRLAIRLMFLWGLKLLSDKNYITWEPGKTNRDYLMEIQSKTVKNSFSDLNYYFEYAWYGQFPVSQELFNKVNRNFVQWKAGL